jgi:S-adenosylmethionine/arginine decarboxylase-like enzyme
MKQYLAGKTVKIIVENCAKWELDNKAKVESLLRHIVHVIDMNMLAGPFTVEMCDILERPQDDGISSVIIVSESHAAIHCWPHYKSARIVIDSCREFSVDLVASLLLDVLAPNLIKIADEVWREYIE